MGDGKAEDRKMEKKTERKESKEGVKHQQQPVSRMQPVALEAYGGGLYGKEEEEKGSKPQQQPQQPAKHPASDSQSADGPVDAAVEPKHQPPPSTGDRDVDITGQSYIQ